MSDFVRYFFSAGGLVFVVLGFALWMAARPGSRAARRGILLVALLYIFASIYGVPYTFERLLLRGYHPLTARDVPRGRTAIVVLGSGSFTARDWDGGEYTVVDTAAAERVREAMRVYRLIGADWVISSGGRVDPSDPNTPTGIAIRKALIDLGVPESRMLTQANARNTYEEAAALAPLLQRIGAEHVVLVTSGRHMRRAAGTFRAAGIDVIPAVARNTFLDQPWSDWWLPSDSGLWETGSVTHEYLGIAAYAALRRYAF